MTQYWTVALTDSAEHPDLQAAAKLIRQGQQVAFPTETVYGLGADATQTNAVKGIFSAKGRPADNPLIVHIWHKSQLDGLVKHIDEVSQQLMDAFWPGPLTLVLSVQPGAVSPLVTAGLATVAVRMPAHAIALALIEAAGCPIAAPSANRSGSPSPTQGRHVRDDLEGRIAGIVDAGPTGVGVESTVVEVVEGSIHLLRPGGITAEQLLPFATNGLVKSAAAEMDAPKSPGMKYAHYAPKGALTLVKGSSSQQIIRQTQQLIDEAKAAGHTTGVLTCEEHQAEYRADLVIACGSLAQPESIAQGLFAGLRRFDEEHITFIAAEAFPEEGIGSAVSNRLEKAAGERILLL